ncbi:hypothetical protein GCM10022289_23990 [Pedobacter jeongneungensis]|uniref:Acyltransferase n=1 Tax=Pedobacter jeongneungensis TaxID=947309 RepID=A0ABP8BFF8_9SPHI
MSIKSISKKIAALTLNKIISRIYIKQRILKYKLLSNCKTIIGKPILTTPMLALGQGIVRFGENVNLGVYGSPNFFNSYIYIEARNTSSSIVFGDNIYINNNASFISEGAGIVIKNDVLIGPNFSVFDSDFHEIDPNKRLSGKHITREVIINENVFIGSNVTILKGVEIGRNSVIASGSVVTKSVEANIIAGGNPCKFIKQLNV